MNLRKLFTMIHTKTRRYDSHPACCDVKPAAPEPLKDIFPFFTGTLSLRLAFFDMIIITIEQKVCMLVPQVCVCVLSSLPAAGFYKHTSLNFTVDSRVPP